MPVFHSSGHPSPSVSRDAAGSAGKWSRVRGGSDVESSARMPVFHLSGWPSQSPSTDAAGSPGNASLESHTPSPSPSPSSFEGTR